MFTRSVMFVAMIVPSLLHPSLCRRYLGLYSSALSDSNDAHRSVYVAGV